MADIVDRLKNQNHWHEDLYGEAADEIERLRKALYHCVNAISEWEKRPLGIEPWLLGAMDNARAVLEGK